MRLATMVRGYLPVPRPVDMIYAPIDMSVTISEGLAKRGHEVVYFAPNGSHLNTKVETLNLRPLAHNVGEFSALLSDVDQLSHNVPGLWDQFLAREMFERASAGEFDLLHFHHPEAAMTLAKLYPNVPVVYTLHDPLVAWFREAMEMFQTPNQFCISISNNQRIPAPDLRYVSTVYNGIDTDMYSFCDNPDDYLLFSGRIVPDKGVKEAIWVAQQTNSRLLIIGPTYRDQEEYFAQHIRPHLNEKILYLGFMERSQMIKYYQKARAQLFPVQWEEPFGLTMIEAMSCGTPVVAMRRGSVPEVVRDGKTGYIANSLAEMVTAVNKISKIRRADCRAHIQEKFSLEHMVDGYEAAFVATLKRFHSKKTIKSS